MYGTRYKGEEKISDKNRLNFRPRAHVIIFFIPYLFHRIEFYASLLNEATL